MLSFHEILLDNARHSVTVNNQPIELTYKEYSLLRLLLENTNLVVTRETILQVVWGTDISVESRTVDMHIRTLRKKLGDAGTYICTIRKVGYKLADDEEAGENEETAQHGRKNQLPAVPHGLCRGCCLTAALCIFVFHRAFTAQAWDDLEKESDLIRAGYDLTSEPQQLFFVTATCALR